MDKGFARRLMRDYWETSKMHVDILCPALIGFEAGRAPFWPTGHCTFQNEQGLCELHDLKLKPLEGRVSSCKSFHKGLHEAMMQAWNNPEAQEIVRQWREMVGE